MTGRQPRHLFALFVLSWSIAIAQPTGDQWLDLVEAGTAEAIAEALEAGADPNAVGRFGKTPLIAAACCNSDADVVVMLLDAGADINAVNQFGNTALHVASRSGTLEVVRALRAAGADPNAVNDQGLVPGDFAQDNPALTNGLAYENAVSPFGGQVMALGEVDLETLDVLTVLVDAEGNLDEAARSLAGVLPASDPILAILVQGSFARIVISGSDTMLFAANLSTDVLEALSAGSAVRMFPSNLVTAGSLESDDSGGLSAGDPLRTSPVPPPEPGPPPRSGRSSGSSSSSSVGGVSCTSRSGGGSSSVSCRENGREISRTTCTTNPVTYEVTCSSWSNY